MTDLCTFRDGPQIIDYRGEAWRAGILESLRQIAWMFYSGTQVRFGGPGPAGGHGDPVEGNHLAAERISAALSERVVAQREQRLCMSSLNIIITLGCKLQASQADESTPVRSVVLAQSSWKYSFLIIHHSGKVQRIHRKSNHGFF